MRQLGIRSSEPTPAETDGVAPSEILPHERFAAEDHEPFRVEVYRIERNPAEPAPIERPQKAKLVSTEREPDRVEPPQQDEVASMQFEPAPVEPLREPEIVSTHPSPLPEPDVREAAGVAGPTGRWEEFSEPRMEPGYGDRIRLDSLPPLQSPSRGLLAADREPERRSSFLTLAVPGIAAVLAVGVLFWSGSRLRRQDAAMSSLQEQNQKLADTLARMNVEHTAPDVPPSAVSQNPGNGPSPAARHTATTLGGPPAPVGQSRSRSAHGNEAATASSQKDVAQHVNRQGVAAPPPVQQGARISSREKGHRAPSEAGYAPEIVPPYPTLSSPQNATTNAATSQPAPSGGTYSSAATPTAVSSSAQPPVASAVSQGPSQVAGPDRSTTRPVTTPRQAVAQVPAASSRSSPASNSGPSSTVYSATGNGQFASPLAQNIETVEGLQRHSPMPLKEFHARTGTSTQATPSLRLSVQNADQNRGTYVVMVSASGSSSQLRGEVNHPLVLADNANHHVYELIVLSIADQQVYGYLRTAR